MSTALTPFAFKDHSIRTVFEAGQPWFVARDVCKALGIGWTGHTLDSIPTGWKGMVRCTTPQEKQRFKAITEPAVYKLAFRSNKPEADEFTNWVASVVLPSIRKTGQFAAKTEPAALTPSTAEDRRPLAALTNTWAVLSKQSYRDAWKQVSAHFALTTVKDLPIEWLPDAISFVQSKIDSAQEQRALSQAPMPLHTIPDIPESARPSELIHMLETYAQSLNDVLSAAKRTGMDVSIRPIEGKYTKPCQFTISLSTVPVMVGMA